MLFFDMTKRLNEQSNLFEGNNFGECTNVLKIIRMLRVAKTDSACLYNRKLWKL